MAKDVKLLRTTTFFTVFVKFSRRIPNSLCIQDEVRNLHSRVFNVRKPRQKNARWILVDFENLELAEEFKKILEEKKHISTLPVKIKKLNIKQNENSKHGNERQDRINSLSRNSFDSKKFEKFSNKLLITNLSKEITMKDLREWLPNHLHIDLKHRPRTRAIVTYSSAKDAMEARIALKPIIAKEKFRVIILLLRDKSDDKRTNKKNKNSSGRYFEDTIK